MPTASLRALLAQSIDYAGMFPPCSLALEPALQNQAKYVRSPDAWMLNTCVLPIEQFDTAKQFLSEFDPSDPLRVAALGPKTADAEPFLDAVEDADAAIRWLSSNVDLVAISHLEMFLPHDVDSALLQEAKSIIGDLPVFWEAPPERRPSFRGAAHECRRCAQKSYSFCLQDCSMTFFSPWIPHFLLSIPNQGKAVFD